MACGGGVRNIEVKAQEPVLVQPLSTAQSSAYNLLTKLDQTLAQLVVQIVFVFDVKNPVTRRPHDGADPAKLLKEALRKVLVPFYPLAGRLCLSPDDGSLFIDCNAQGVSFVEANADADISELGDFSQPDFATLGSLVFPLPPIASDDRPLLSAQVTRFKCGGFVLGFAFNHCLFDAFALSEFLNAWAETACSVPLSTPPVLDRTFPRARSPLQIKYPHTEFLEIEDVSLTQNISVDAINRSFCFTSASLEILRKKALEDGVLSKCTTFEALSGLIWRARTRALWSDYPEHKVKVLILVDTRARFEPSVVPKGYVGNAVLFTCALASARELEENPLSHAVKHVQHAIGRMTEEYMLSQIDYMEHQKVWCPPLGASTSVMTKWSRLAFNILDFGWGRPKYVGPATSLLMETATFLSYGKGMSVVLALPPEAMRKFEEIVHPYLNP